MHSGSTGYFFHSDKISGRTFDGNHELLLLCTCHFYLFIYTHQQLLLFLEKQNLAILRWAIFLQREAPEGLFPKDCSRVATADRKRMTRLHQFLLRKWLAKGRQFSWLSQWRSQLTPLPTSPVTAAPLA